MSFYGNAVTVNSVVPTNAELKNGQLAITFLIKKDNLSEAEEKVVYIDLENIIADAVFNDINDYLQTTPIYTPEVDEKDTLLFSPTTLKEE